MDVVSWIVVGGLVVIVAVTVALLKWWGRRSSPPLDAEGLREVQEAQEAHKQAKYSRDNPGPGPGPDLF